MKNVLIGIQARTGSSRLFNKISMQIGEISIIHRVIYQAVRTAGWFSSHKDISVKPVLLCPKDDPIRSHVEHKITVFEGSEDDVLDRYYQASKLYNADYIVRITGDCPWINAQIISKCIRDAIRKDADYCSNILVRTFIEGQDTEVMSRRCLEWLNQTVKDKEGREHVTSFLTNTIRNGIIPDGITVHTVLNSFDLSGVKTSIDTQEEYEKAIEMFDSYQQKKYMATKYGSIAL